MPEAYKPYEDYPYVAAWERQMGAAEYYVYERVAEARRDGAPQNATIKENGVWATVDDITNNRWRIRLGLPPLADHLVEPVRVELWFNNGQKHVWQLDKNNYTAEKAIVEALGAPTHLVSE